MVRLFLSADANLQMSRLVKQLKVLDVPTEVLWHEHKLFCDVPFDLLQRRIPCLDTVERVFLCLHREELHTDHPLIADGPDYSVLQRLVREADWGSALADFRRLHGTDTSWRWHVDCRRRAPRDSKLRAVD